MVHEAYIRLVGTENRNWDRRGHFFAAAAEAMRRILIETARRKRTSKHGGDRQSVALDAVDFAFEESSDDLIAMDEALTKLSVEDPGLAELVKLRYFAGLTIEQVAQIQGISRRTAIDHWAYARAWLRRQIGRDSKPD